MITIHHLENSRSQMVIWLMEEIGAEYEIKTYPRDKQTNLATPEYKALHPLGKSPIVQDGETILVESGAILEYLVDKFPEAGLAPSKENATYLSYKYWIHAAEGSYMPPMVMGLMFTVMETRAPFFVRPIVKAATGAVRNFYLNDTISSHLAFVDATLQENSFLTGDQFSAADIIMHFPLESAITRAGLGPQYPAMLEWSKRVAERPAFKRMKEKAGDRAPIN